MDTNYSIFNMTGVMRSVILLMSVSFKIQCHQQSIGKSFSSPDEVRTFEKGKIEIVNFPDSGVTIGRGTLELGWSWGKCIKPLVKTDSC